MLPMFSTTYRKSINLVGRFGLASSKLMIQEVKKNVRDCNNLYVRDREHWNANLTTMSCGSFQAYILGKIFPMLVAERRIRRDALLVARGGVEGTPICTYETILHECGLKRICLSTACLSTA